MKRTLAIIFVLIQSIFISCSLCIPVINIFGVLFNIKIIGMLFGAIFLFSFFITWLTTLKLVPYLISKNEKLKNHYVFAVVTSILMFFLFPLKDLLSSTSIFLNIIIAIGLFLIVFNFSQLISFSSVLINYINDKKWDLKRFSMLFGAILFLQCGLFLLIYYPGIMSYDSIVQWQQARSMQLDDWHPVFHTLILKVATEFWKSPAAFVIFQSLLMIVLFISGLYFIKKNGGGRLAAFLYVLMLVLNPINSIYVVTLWKDVIYAYALMFLTFLLSRVFFTKGRWLENKKNFILLIIICLFTALIRHNGIVPVLLTLTVMFFSYRKHWRKTVLIFLSVLTLMFVLKPIAYDAMDVKKTRAFQSLVNPIMQVAGVIYYNGIISVEEKKEIEKILPISQWKHGYKKFSEVPLASEPGFNSDYFEKNKINFLKTWVGIVIKNPDKAVLAYLDRTAIVWRVTPKNDMDIYTNSFEIFENNLGFQTESKIPIIKLITDTFYFLSATRPLIWLTWTPALYIYVMIALCFWLVVKRGWRVLLIVTPVFANILGLLIVTTAPQTRYFYSSIIILPFIAALFLIKNQKEMIDV